jgi:hypothetical protein
MTDPDEWLLTDDPPINNKRQQLDDSYAATKALLGSHKSLHLQLVNAFWAYYEMDTLIPQTERSVGSGHFFPYSQSYIELEHSFLLAAQGLYTYAFAALRSCLELGALGVYFAVEDREYETVRPWIRSRERTPGLGKALERIGTIREVRVFERRFGLLRGLRTLHDHLSRFVHTRGYQYSSTYLHGSNLVTFAEGTFVMYVIQGVLPTVRDLITLMLLKWPVGMQELPVAAKYGLDPPLGGYLEEGSLERVRRLLDPAPFAFLKTLSDLNPRVAAVVAEYESLPDLTEDEWAIQVAEVETARSQTTRQ